MIYPYLLYCVLAWGKANMCVLDPLVKSQKRAIRMICGLRKYDSTSASFKDLKIMKLLDLYPYAVNIFMYKYSQGDLPELFNNYYRRNDTYHSHATRQKDYWRPPLVRTKLANNFIKKQGAIIWNVTVQNISWDGLLGSFKSNVKKSIFEEYWSSTKIPVLP